MERALREQGVRPRFILESREGIAIGLANPGDLATRGVYATSGGTLELTRAVKFTSKEIAKAVKAFCEALPDKLEDMRGGS
jgi:hypothetical protein